MLPRRGVSILALALAMGLPACKFSRSANTLPTTTTSESTIAVIGDDTSTSIDDPSSTTTVVVAGGPSTTRKATPTTAHLSATATTRRPVSPATTARPRPTCSVSVPDAFYGGSWTASVNTPRPNASVTLEISWPGSSGSYTGMTDAGGNYTKTQRVQPSMRNQTVQVRLTSPCVASTSFRVS